MTELDPHPSGFVQAITRYQAVAMVMGSMIGTGVFIVSADMVRQVHFPGLVLLAWALAGLILIMGGLTYAELGGMYPRAGGLYIYLREGCAPVVGFLYGWTLLAVVWTGGTAAVAVGFARYAAVIFPGLSAEVFLGSTVILPSGPISIGISPQRILAVLTIAVLTWINIRGVKTAAAIQAAFTLIKIGAVIALIVLGLTMGKNPSAITVNFGPAFWPADLHQVSLSAFGAAMVGPLFTMDGWYAICFAGSELKNGKRDLPFALVVGTSLIAVLFLLLNTAYFSVLPSAAIAGATQDRVASTVMEGMFGPMGGKAMAGAIMIASFGMNLGLLLGGARVFYAMAQDGLFLKSAGTLHPRYRTPAVALTIQGLWIAVLCLSGTFAQLVDFTLAASLIFYVLTPIALFVLRFRQPDLERPVRVWGYPVVPALYTLATAAVGLDLVLLRPAYTLPGLVLVLLGLPVYLARKRALERAAAP